MNENIKLIEDLYKNGIIEQQDEKTSTLKIIESFVMLLLAIESKDEERMVILVGSTYIDLIVASHELGINFSRILLDLTLSQDIGLSKNEKVNPLEAISGIAHSSLEDNVHMLEKFIVDIIKYLRFVEKDKSMLYGIGTARCINKALALKRLR